MCGIVGVAGRLTTKEEQVFKDLLFFDTVRGIHSTGVVAVDSSFSVNTLKKALPAPEFLELSRFSKVMGGINRVLIGHNRSATSGKVIDENAHPFTHGNIVGVHNGTLDRTHKLPEKHTFTVDSDNLIYSMDKEGVAATYKLLQGSCAMVWWNKQSNTLHMLRNDERPLHYGYLKGSEVIVFASELEMLRFAVRRKGLEFEKDETYSVATDTLYTFEVPQNIVKNIYKVERPTITKLEPAPYVAPIINYYHQGSQAAYGRRNDRIKDGNKAKGKKGPVLGGFLTKGVTCAFKNIQLFGSSLEGRTLSGDYKVKVYFPQSEIYKSLLRTLQGATVDMLGTIAWVDNKNATEPFIGIAPDSVKLVKASTEKKGGPSAQFPNLSEKKCTRYNGLERTEGYLLHGEAYNVWDNVTVDMDTWLHYTACGCAVCKVAPSIWDADQLIWENMRDFYCDDICKAKDKEDLILGEAANG
jgi:predicted glutamine amidotransferase